MITESRIEDYEKLVYSIINKYSFFGDVEDLYQVGMKIMMRVLILNFRLMLIVI